MIRTFYIRLCAFNKIYCILHTHVGGLEGALIENMVKVLLYIFLHNIEIEVFVWTLVFKLLKKQVHSNSLNCTEPLPDLTA